MVEFINNNPSVISLFAVSISFVSFIIAYKSYKINKIKLNF
jgi:hypothetical protein